MNDRRLALLGRFRKSSRERAQRLLGLLREIENQNGTQEVRRDFARELHTLKGDSMVVGMEALGEVCHAAEEVNSATERGTVGEGVFVSVVRTALEQVIAVLSDELDATAAKGVLKKIHATLLELAYAEELANADGDGAAGPTLPLPPESIPAPAKVEDGPSPAPDQPPETKAERWIDVPARRVDALCEGLSDFAGDFRQLTALVQRLSTHQGALSSSEARALSQATDRCQTKLVDLISSAWSLRMVSVEPTFADLARHAQELGLARDKQLDISLSCEGVAVERSVLDELWEPLLHVVRNAVDHGIEPASERGSKGPRGRLEIVARSAGPNLFLSVSDDGRGIDPAVVRAAAVQRGLISEAKLAGLSDAELVELVFLHGLSTRTTVTDISGRGLGLDVVRSKLQGIGGQVSLKSTPGLGTRFELLVPSTLSLERTLVTECAGGLYGLPAGQILEVVQLRPEHVEPIVGGVVLRYRGEPLPLQSLSDLLGATVEREDSFAAIIDFGARRRAIGLQKLLGEREVLRRPTDALLSSFDHIAASAMLDDGAVVLLLSLPGLLRRVGAGARRRLAEQSAPERTRVLVVDDSNTVRDLLVELLSEAGLEVMAAENGRAGLALLEQGPMPDLVLTDLEMPVMDGFELLKRVRARWQYLPVVLLTTRGSAADRRQATALGADAYVVKSEFQEGKLLEVIRRFVAARRA